MSRNFSLKPVRCSTSWGVRIGVFAMTCFLLASTYRGTPSPQRVELADQVVLPAVVQVGLYGGDRFLAASVESVRAAASGHALDAQQGGYRLRAHRAVAQLNPCHEDNYWIGNAALSFGGAPDAGSELLGRAAQCRFWDEMPPFLYGFNKKFFNLDVATARRAIELAADRSTANAAGFRQMAIMMTVNSIKDAQAALAILRTERESARDPKLRYMLDQRIARMEGLIILRDAHKVYEDRFGRPLQDPMLLVQSGVLKNIPHDPLRLGYEFRNGEFHLRRVQVAGLD